MLGSGHCGKLDGGNGSLEVAGGLHDDRSGALDSRGGSGVASDRDLKLSSLAPGFAGEDASVSESCLKSSSCLGELDQGTVQTSLVIAGPHVLGRTALSDWSFLSLRFGGTQVRLRLSDGLDLFTAGSSPLSHSLGELLLVGSGSEEFDSIVINLTNLLRCQIERDFLSFLLDLLEGRPCSSDF